MNDSTVSWSNNRSGLSLISFVNWFLFLNLNLNSLLVNSRSNYSLFVVFVTINIDSLDSWSVLVNSVSSDWISVNNLIRRILIINLNILFLQNWLNVWLSNVLISWKGVISDLWVVLYLYRSLNGWESSSNVLRRSYSNLFIDSSNSWLNKVRINNLVSFNLYVFGYLSLFELSWSSNWASVYNSVLLFLECWSQFFSDSSNRWLDNNFLSSWFNNLLSNNSWLSNYSLSDNLWFSRNSLSDDSWLNSNVFGSYFCISQ